MKKDYRKLYKEHYGIEFGNEYEIHHIDLNHQNNNIENLLLLPKSLHQKYHIVINLYSELLENPPTLQIVGLTDRGGNYFSYYLKGVNEMCNVLSECSIWYDYKKYLSNQIPNIHNVVLKTGKI